MQLKTIQRNPPAQKISVGNIQVAIWENKSNSGKKFSTVTSDRSYKNGEEWKNTNSFRTSDLLKASFALQKAFELLTIKEHQNQG